VKIKVFSTFSGYGGWEFGLQEQGIDHELVGYSEVDKFAIQCFEQNHEIEEICYDGEGNKFPGYIPPKNYGDITKINQHELPDFDLFVSSPPCQAFSVAGKGQGKDDEKGRGRLFEDAINIMKVKQPKYAVYENVKGLTFKKHKEYFDHIVHLMQDAGYNVFYKVLNTKDFGIPQNRERIFFVCIRKDIDSSYFQFPQEFPLELKLKDILEEQVDAKYYLKPEQVERLLANVKEKGVWNSNPSAKGMNGNVNTNEVSTTLSTNKGEGSKITIPCLTPDRIEKRQNGRRFKEDGEPSFTLNAQDKHGILQVTKSIRVGGIYDKDGSKHQAGSIYDVRGIAPPLDTAQGGNRQPFITHPTITQALGRSGSSSEYMNSVKAVSSNTLTIRKLTPIECFRLQGFLKDQINLEGLSDSQKYKLAGNGVSINVVGLLLKAILRND
jgi:DNA (cytosine-5)-methyltransferase 1